MDNPRPFSDPVSVSFAGLALLALAVGSFTSGLLRQLKLPRAETSARVVLLDPNRPAPSPPKAEPLAASALAAQPAPPQATPRPHRRPPTETPPVLLPAIPPAPTTPEPATSLDDGADTAAIAPAAGPAEPPIEAAGATP